MKEVNYANLDTDSFEYTHLMDYHIAAFKVRMSVDDKGRPKEDRISGSDKLARRKASQEVQKRITFLMNTGNDNAKRHGKRLKLEREYVAAKESRVLKDKISRVLDCPASGVYTLSEIGDVLGITRERVRQLEASSLKILKHPNMARILRDHKYD